MIETATPPRPRGRKLGRRVFGLVVLVAAVGLGYAAFRGWGPSPTIPLPDPNGYDDLTLAGRMIVGQLPWKVRAPEAGPEEIRPYVESNREALALGRQGLARESRVPLKYSEADLDGARIGQVRALGRLLLSEGRLAETEGRLSGAMVSYLETARLGPHVSRGGLMLDALAGWAIEGTGLDALRGIRDRLPEDDLREAIRELEAIDRNREPCRRVVANEDAWRKKAVPLYTRAVLGVTGMGNRLLAPAYRAAELALQRTEARLRLLLSDLAIRAYRLETGSDPETLADLVPRYLATIPVDPYSGRPLVYRRGEGDGDYRLYCVGPDGRDDGGRPLPERSDWSTASGDVLIDPLEEPQVGNVGNDSPDGSDPTKAEATRPPGEGAIPEASEGSVPPHQGEP
jgi:hypothetical protein